LNQDVNAARDVLSRIAQEVHVVRQNDIATWIVATVHEKLSEKFENSPMKRAKLQMLKRNPVVGLGKIDHPEGVDVVIRALNDPEPLVRNHAIGRSHAPP
jgi:epoxyqueuosine reductase QueG